MISDRLAIKAAFEKELARQTQEIQLMSAAEQEMRDYIFA